MTRRILIADDEPLARDRLRRLLEAQAEYQVCAEAGDGEAVLDAVARENPDIVLLDIRMPGLDGLQVAQHLANLANPPALIFCTAYDKYAIDAFNYQAIAYLLKPVRREALLEALARAGRINRVQLNTLLERSQLPAQSRPLVTRTHRGTELIDLARVLFCQADHKYVTLVHSDGETLTDLTLKELEQTYPNALLRIHRNTLVNTRHIAGLIRGPDGHTRLSLRDRPEQLDVSRRHVSSVRDWLEQHGPSAT